MNVNVIPTKPFEREAKFLLKKYISLKAELVYDKSEYEDISNSKIAERIDYVKTILEDNNESEE